VSREKRSPGAVSSAMKDHTTRRMYTKRAPGDINIYAMKEDLTTQELSKEEKARLANERWYERNRARLRAEYLENKEIFKAKRDLTYKENRDLMLERAKKHYKKNQDRNLIYAREYRVKNKEKIKLREEKNREKYKKMRLEKYPLRKEKYINNIKRWNKENKDRINKSRRKYVKAKRQTNLEFKLTEILRCKLLTTLRAKNVKKQMRALELVGCTLQELKEHLESQWHPGMNWDNHTKTGWHIDHIKPCNTFDLTDIEQQKLCFHYTNLRPLWADDNYTRPKNGSDIFTIPIQTQ